MVFTDTFSHACISGQHAFVDTFIIRLEACRVHETAPYHVLRRGIAPATSAGAHP
jgi:hypothetical protein